MTEHILVGAATLHIAKASAITDPIDDHTKAEAALDDTNGTHKYVGETDEGCTFTYNLEKSDIMRDQRLAPAATTVTGAEGSLDTNLGDYTIANFQLACGGGTITTNSDSSKTFTPADDSTFISAIIKPLGADDYLWVPRFDISGGLTLTWNKGKDSQTPLKLKLLQDPARKPFYYIAGGSSKTGIDAGLLSNS